MGLSCAQLSAKHLSSKKTFADGFLFFYFFTENVTERKEYSMRQKAETRSQDALLKTKTFYYNFHNANSPTVDLNFNFRVFWDEFSMMQHKYIYSPCLDSI